MDARLQFTHQAGQRLARFCGPGKGWSRSRGAAPGQAPPAEAHEGSRRPAEGHEGQVTRARVRGPRGRRVARAAEPRAGNARCLGGRVLVGRCRFGTLAHGHRLRLARPAGIALPVGAARACSKRSGGYYRFARAALRSVKCGGARRGGRGAARGARCGRSLRRGCGREAGHGWWEYIAHQSGVSCAIREQQEAPISAR